MEITERLRNTPTGLIVLVGDMKIIVEKYRPYYNGQNKIPCRGCVFRTRERDSANTARLAWPILGRTMKAWFLLKQIRFNHSS